MYINVFLCLLVAERGRVDRLGVLAGAVHKGEVVGRFALRCILTSFF